MAYYIYGDNKLEIVDVINYLGLNLSYTGKFSCTQRNIADMGLRAFYALKRDVHELVYPNAAMLCRLFDKLVAQVILYASEIWDYTLL